MEIKYSITKDNLPAKLNPQQKQLVEALQIFDGQVITKEDILPEITKTLVTRQDPWLILKYYQPGFLESGFITIEKTKKPKVLKTPKQVEMDLGLMTEAELDVSEEEWDSIPDDEEVTEEV
jgi:hypothetical protein